MATASVVATCVALSLLALSVCQYAPTWDSLDKRPLPSWYDESKIGIFIHWGVFSVPSFNDEWFWDYWQGPKPVPAVVEFMKKNYRPDFTYADFAPQFTAEFFDPEQWAEIFKASGARYIVFVTKHHEGFTNWPSNVSFNWNSMQVGPKRDLVGELTDAVRNRTDLRMGLYHSLFEWFNQIFLQDRANNYTTHMFAQGKSIPELHELVSRYKPEVIWSDGNVGHSSYWNSTGFLAWLYNESPVKDTVVTNDRWGDETTCKHGGFYTCQDRYNPGRLINHKWENCLTIDRQSWGFRREAQLEDYLTTKQLTTTIAETISCGGNVLINVGPTHDGRIVPIFEERLRELGQWLKVTGEAVYSTKPWTHQNDTHTPHVWYTMKNDPQGQTTVYAFVLQWPILNTLSLGAPVVTQETSIRLLGYSKPLTFEPMATKVGVSINIPVIRLNEMPVKYTWVFKITHVAN